MDLFQRYFGEFLISFQKPLFFSAGQLFNKFLLSFINLRLVKKKCFLIDLVNISLRINLLLAQILCSVSFGNEVLGFVYFEDRRQLQLTYLKKLDNFVKNSFKKGL